jgi:hypothetical protein
MINLTNRTYTRRETGVGGGGSDVSVKSGIVEAGGLLEGLSGAQDGAAGGVVGGGVVGHEVEDVVGAEEGEHCDRW